jgi:hypothetical protein
MIPTWPTDRIKAALLDALRALDIHDSYLLKVAAHERAITHALAVHLQEQFKAWHLDCEFNRRGKEPKVMQILQHRYARQNGEPRSAAPDIIVHKRGPSGPNVLVVEAKKYRCDAKAAAEIEYDLEKLRAFTSDPNYLYELGAFLLLDPSAKGIMLSWFQANVAPKPFAVAFSPDFEATEMSRFLLEKLKMLADRWAREKR